ncbi:MAG: hypothetical protein ACTSUE_18535 [Promethearchaeota archaeon]
MSEYDEPLDQDELNRELVGEGLVEEATKEIVINFWKTKIHDASLGIRQQEQYRSRSRKYNKGMEVRGEVSFKSSGKKDKSQTKLIIGFNTDFWENENSSYIKRHNPKELYKRISLRLFSELKDGKGGNWMGSLEQSLTESIVNSMTQNKPLPVFVLDIPRYDYLIRLNRGKTLVGHRYCFTLIPDKNWKYSLDKKVRFFSIESKRVAMGLDFKVIELGGMNDDEVVAEIDEKKFDVGGKWVIKLKDPSLEKNHVFKHTLILFSCLCKYLDKVNENTEKLYSLMSQKGNYLDTINEELSYFKNPRYRK